MMEHNVPNAIFRMQDVNRQTPVPVGERQIGNAFNVYGRSATIIKSLHLCIRKRRYINPLDCVQRCDIYSIIYF